MPPHPCRLGVSLHQLVATALMQTRRGYAAPFPSSVKKATHLPSMLCLSGASVGVLGSLNAVWKLSVEGASPLFPLESTCTPPDRARPPAESHCLINTTSSRVIKGNTTIHDMASTLQNSSRPYDRDSGFRMPPGESGSRKEIRMKWIPRIAVGAIVVLVIVNLFFVGAAYYGAGKMMHPQWTRPAPRKNPKAAFG